MLAPIGEDFGMSVQHYPTEFCPIFVVVIHDDRHRRILGDIPQALEREAARLFRLVVNRDVESVLRYGEAHRYNMRDRSRVGSGEMRDPSMIQKSALRLR